MRRPTVIKSLTTVWLNLFLLTTAWAQVPLPGQMTIFGSTLSLDQDITVSVSEINAISVSGNVTLNIASATAGSNPDPDADVSSTYNVTVNGASKKLSGSLDVLFSAGISLDALLTAPTGGTANVRTLSTTNQDLITGFGLVAETGLAITYTASVTPQAAPNGAGETRTVTITLTDN